MKNLRLKGENIADSRIKVSGLQYLNTINLNPLEFFLVHIHKNALALIHKICYLLCMKIRGFLTLKKKIQTEKYF